ncbi:MAG: DNA mismatch repair endonuclease MutL [Puniceicoccales bacterium]|jgi:DNA mismatch repair protein MutL|nr:DNA mismatch repair endonuclease MutL [Puniceicoccales bacterium]
MPEIRVLPDKVANQIAAGEVVERPASVVKELLENSLDAGATRITIEFRNGGKAFIAVEDNGCGMTPDQALMALETHATSKIRSAEDLNEIHTFGFRGEAVPSIASVSRFTLKTRPADAVTGSEIFVNAGKLTHQRETGMAPGTRIEVAALFHPVPARLKFLKSDNTEAAHITRLVRLYAVAQPQVGFRLVEDGVEIFRSPEATALQERVREIWGRQLAADLTAFEPVETSGMRVHGLLGKPGVGRTTRQEMVTIVNGRPVDCRTLAYALVESYHTLLPKGRYPLAFLFLDIDPHWVDVNVHPSKREIRFRDEGRVRHFVITAVLRHLEALSTGLPPVPLQGGRITLPDEVPEQQAAVDGGDSEGGGAAPNPPAPEPAAQEDRPGSAAPAEVESGGRVNVGAAPGAVAASAAPSPASALPRIAPPQAAPPFRLTGRLVGRLGNGIFLFEVKEDLVVLNLRAARERIWYERVLRRFEEHTPVSQQLLLPLPLELDPLAASVLRERREVFLDAGFDIEEFGRNFFRVQAVPDWLPEPNVEQCVRDIIAGIGRRAGDFQRAHIAHELLAKIAGERSGSGEAASDAMVNGIVRELFLCRQPTVCPNGKPVFFQVTRAEIIRRLGG